MSEFLLKSIFRYPARIVKKPFAEGWNIARAYTGFVSADEEEVAETARYFASLLVIAYDYVELPESARRDEDCIGAWRDRGYEIIPPHEFRGDEVKALLRNELRQVVPLRKIRYRPLGPNDDHGIIVLLRGTCFISWSDILADFGIVVESLHRSERVANTQALVEELVGMYNHRSICLVGHSLGAAIAFIIARNFHLRDPERSLEGHYFNLPYMCLETLFQQILHLFEIEYAFFRGFVNILSLRSRLEQAKRRLAERTTTALGLHERAQEAAREFCLLKDWRPNIYVNQYDRISKTYIDYFKDADPEDFDDSGSHDDATRFGMSRFTAILAKFGLDSKAHHLCPSANLIISAKGISTVQSHSLKNWANVKARDIRIEQYQSLARVHG